MAKYTIDNDNRTVTLTTRSFSNLSTKERAELTQLKDFGYLITVTKGGSGDKKTKKYFEKALASNPSALKEFEALCADKGFFAAKAYARTVLGEDSEAIEE